MPAFEQWQIWDVNFPFRLEPGFKNRPALLTSTSGEIASGAKLRFAYTTSIDHPEVDYRVEIWPADPDLQCEPNFRLTHCWIHCAEMVYLTPADVTQYRGLIAGDLKAQAMEIYGLA